MGMPLKLIGAGELNLHGHIDPEFTDAHRRFLAEGDSWFSIGSMNLFESANLLQSMAFSSRAAAVHCAYPGDTLRRMGTLRSDPQFVQLMTGNASWRYDGILLSAGGNDLIEAASAAPAARIDRRLLRTAAEWGVESAGPLRYLSADGWRTFSSYFRANLDAIVALRDSKRGANGNFGRPIFMHTYAYPTPRPSGAGLGQGPWLLPSMQTYGLPELEWPAIARCLLDQLAELLLSCAADKARFPALHVFDTRTVNIDAAAPGSTGTSGDWVNEIHLTRAGCTKVALPWCAQIENVLALNP